AAMNTSLPVRLWSANSDLLVICQFAIPSGLVSMTLCPSSLCGALGLRDVEDLLAARGVALSYEAVRRWRLPIRRRPPGRDQSLSRRSQRQFQTIRVGRRSRQSHRRRQTRAPKVRFDLLGARPDSVWTA